MKAIYKTLLMGMVYLLSNTAYAQILQYSDDGTKGCIDCEEKSGRNYYCYCNFLEDLPRFHDALSLLEASKKQEWLIKQENGLKDVIEFRFGEKFNDFEQAQRAFFKAYASVPASKDILNSLELEVTSKRVPKEIEKDINYYQNSTVKKLIEYNNAGTSNKLGDLKMNGKYLRDIPNHEAVGLLTGLDNTKKDIASELTDIYRVINGIPKIRHNGVFEESIVNSMIDHYRSFDVLNRVILMNKYLIDQNVHPPLQSIDAYPPKMYNVHSYNHRDIAYNMARSAGSSVQIAYPQVTDEESVAYYAVSTFGNKEFEFVNRQQAVKKEVKDYLGYHRYSAETLQFSEDIFKSYVNNTTFPHDQYNYGLDSGSLFSISFQDEQNKNRLFLMSNHNANQFKKFNGLGNMLSSLSMLPAGTERNEAFIGNFVIEIMKDNNIDMSNAFTGQQAFALFHFRTFGYQNLGRYDLGVDFNGSIGSTLWDNGLKSPDWWDYPYAIEGALALARGETFDFAFRKKVYDLRIALQLNDTQEQWLIGNRGKTENIYNYYSDLNEAGAWSNQEVLFVTNAINVLMVDSSANPLLGADCRSFEYALPPGALQRGCAVKNFDHRFYTAGIRPNGSPYFGTIEVPVDTIYFTMPNWMSNGQAANNTAVAVTAAIKIADVYFFNNPDASEFTVADVFRDALKAELTIVGGSFSLTVEPFPIPSPAPYITSVLGISNPFDCDR